PCPVGSLRTDEVDVDLPAAEVALSDREQETLDARAEADSRRWSAADLLDQPVIAAAAADRVLRADRLVLELEGRARVVVQPTHERRDELVAHAVGVEKAAHLLEVLAALVAERLPDLRRALESLLDPLALDVEDAQRCRRALRACLVVE